jgi:hypothetical protein
MNTKQAVRGEAPAADEADSALERALWIARYMHGCDAGAGPIEALEQAIRELAGPHA